MTGPHRAITGPLLLAATLLQGVNAQLSAVASVRQTWNGCACKKSWGDGDLKCNDYCCNPDNDIAGEWCMVEDINCEDVDWGYCREARMNGVTSSCVDLPSNWADSEGETCKDYIDEMLCNANGGYGPGWDAEWGTFFDFSSGGYSAAAACCGCGGGSRVNGLANTDMCTDLHWKDKDGDDCEAYASRSWCNATGYGIGWHTEWGEFTAFANNGQTAFTACCGCGGGARQGSELLIARTTWNGCSCKKGWTDDDGKKCNGYCCNTDQDPNGEWCKVEDVACEDFDWGYCRPLGALVARGATCADDPPGWVDSEGDSCDVYRRDKYCNDFGGYGPGWEIAWGTFHQFAAQERTAATACCSCGGGAVAWQPTLAQTCEDVPNWKDKDGDDCARYKSMAWCDENGQGPGWHTEWGSFETFRGQNGYTATDACCHCGGGSRTRTFSQSMEVGRQRAEQVVKDKPWVLPAGGVTFIAMIAGCCLACFCVFRKNTPEEVIDKAKDLAENVADKVESAVGPNKYGNRYNTVNDDV